MGKVANDFSDAVNKRERYDDFKELLEKCLSVFEFKAGINMVHIERTINNEWETLYKKYDLAYSRPKEGEHISYLFLRLKDGMINRKEFKEIMQPVINFLNETLENMKIEAEEAEKVFDKDIDELLCSDKNKYIKFFFSQPEVKSKLTKFFQS